MVAVRCVSCYLQLTSDILADIVHCAMKQQSSQILAVTGFSR